jgi:hypothetical protein
MEPPGGDDFTYRSPGVAYFDSRPTTVFSWRTAEEARTDGGSVGEGRSEEGDDQSPGDGNGEDRGDENRH